jgi:non-specific serine/threonine protein kinase
MVDAGEVFHPLRWTPKEAFQLLTDLPMLEVAGVVVRVPGAWRMNRPPRPQVNATVGSKAPSGIGTDALLDFRMEVSLDGERLSSEESPASRELRRTSLHSRTMGCFNRSSPI